MPRKSDEIIKDFINQMGSLIDARLRTFEVNIKGYINDIVKESETRIRKDMATKDDIKNMATKDDIKRLEDKMATKDDLKLLEKKIDIMKDLQLQIDKLKEQVKALEERIQLRN